MNKKKADIRDAEKVAEKMYDPFDYSKDDQVSHGLAVTHEQVSDDYTEGTIDGRIDDVDENGKLASSKGEKIDRGNY
ncbi:YozQ family protein [Sediminibacillus massiliensis]|uniref:YozQ family protein n=1 Tax=Sediminibacillus massiliensis TaxID=1926277 RepID=UPI0009883E13|nr:YozQ family protein [Sediminibacillus massiliensis]